MALFPEDEGSKCLDAHTPGPDGPRGLLRTGVRPAP